MTTFVKSIVRPRPSVMPPLVEHLEERLEDVAVRLLDLVERGAPGTAAGARPR